MDLKIEHLLKNGERSPVLSWFLAPDEQKFLSSKTKNVIFSETYPEEERRRAIVHPPGEEIEPDFRIAILEITAPGPLRHADILGAAIACGVSREVLGDIICGEEKNYLLCAEEIARFLVDNLIQIGKYHVNVRQVESIEAGPTDNYRSASIIVPGLRLDAVLAKCLNLARSKAQELVRAGAVKVNGQVNLNRDLVLRTGDMLSVRRFGRIIVGEVAGKTKKDNLILNIKRTR